MLGVSGKYRLDHRLGGGGMAEVFIGSTMGAEGFSRKVAIKRVLPGYSDNDAFSQMFVAEARISSALVHPNIVSVLDFDRDAERRLFLVMELVDGKDLDALASTGLLPIPVVIFVISEVLRGLGYAHDLPVGTDVRGVVHRDVSPHNVLLSWEGAVKVSDFGIAKARAASEATASVFIKGKPAYMSPEQANGQPLDGRSDLFAVGIMLWEMLVGRRLFEGNDTRATLAAVLFGQVPRPRSIRNDIPKDLERVVMKLLEKEASARYATAEEAIMELSRCTDAPRAGRELLTQTLAERFPHQVPVRQSLMRARAASGGAAPYIPTPMPGTSMPAGTPPYGDAHAVPAAAMPSLGSMRNAPTHTLDLGPPRRRSPVRKYLAIVGVVVASAVATFAIVAGVRGGKTATEPVIAAAGSDAGSPVVPPPVEPDAPTALPPADAAVMAEVVDAPAPPDALPPADAPAPPPDAKPDSHPPPRTTGTGSLYVVADPSLTVFVDRKRYGDTPRTISLSAGTHTVRLENAELGYKKSRTVTIKAGQTEKIELFDWNR